MATRRFDVVILGGGNAGMGVTGPTREAGMSVALLEPVAVGGTCTNRGCTPKKVLVAAAQALHAIERAAFHQIKVGKPKLDWAGLIDREKGLIADLPHQQAKDLVDRGVTLIEAAGRFVGENAIATADDVLEARHIVVATGSKHRPLGLPGEELMITSDEVLSERRQPSSVVFIGGGVIAFEFAHVYARAGTRVTILQPGSRFLGKFDSDAVAQVVAESRRIGIDARLGAEPRRIEKARGGLRVVFEEGGTEQALTADRVIHGAGRVADLDAIDLPAGNVAVADGRIRTDRHMRSTSNAAVFACGDALAGKQQLSPIATYDGTVVGRNIVGAGQVPDYSSIPSCLYTVPALAMVGLTEAEARREGLDCRVEMRDMHEWLSGRTYAETAAWAKVIIDRGSDRILGAHIVGHAGEELIHLFALAMRHGITAGAMKAAVYAYPTFSSDVRYVL